MRRFGFFLVAPKEVAALWAPCQSEDREPRIRGAASACARRLVLAAAPANLLPAAAAFCNESCVESSDGRLTSFLSAGPPWGPPGCEAP